jgi:serine protease Do
MTRGIVSKADTAMDTPWASLSHVIEHDARIRAGNSGGPLVDEAGKLVGVNYAGNDQHDQNLAIHRDEVQEVIDQLIEGENVMSLGINGTALMNEEGEGLGVWVNSVASGSAADEAGVEAGDLLTKMEGVSLGTDGTMADYCSVLETHGPDATLAVDLFRSGEGIYYSGQFNGDAVEAVSVAQDAGASDGGAQGADVEYTTVVDDTQSVAVDVPTDWAGLDTSVFTDPLGGEWAHIDASPDINAFQGGDWSVPGVSIMAAPMDSASFSVEDWLAMAEQQLGQSGCTKDSEDAYSDGLHEGAFTYWTGCGGVGAQYLMLSAYSTDGSYVIALAVQAVSEADLTTIDRALGSFAASF